MKLNSPFLNNLGFVALVFFACSAFSAPTFLYGNNLYTDKKGKKVGDVVTVLVMEAAKAGSNTQTQTGKKNDINIGQQAAVGNKLFSWLPGFGVKGSADINYDGKGTTARNGELKATVTARITEVLDNGNLLIEGTKLVAINSEEEILEVSGSNVASMVVFQIQQALFKKRTHVEHPYIKTSA